MRLAGAELIPPPTGPPQARISAVRPTRWTWPAVAILIGLVVLAPLATIVTALAQPAGDGWLHVQHTLLLRYTLGTAAVVSMTLGWAAVFGVVPAWLVSAFDFPGRRVLSWLLASPLAVPSYIAAIAWAGLLDFTGPVQSALRAVGGREAALWVPDIMSVYGVSFVLGSVLYPYVYVTSRGLLLRQSSSLIEAARCLGAGPTAVFFRVVLPGLRPAVAAGLALVLMETINDYGAVHYFGVDTFTTGIFRVWLGMGDVSSAVRLAAVLLLLTIAALGLERAGRGRRRFDNGGTVRPLARWRPRRLAGLACTLTCSLPVLAGLAIPTGMLVRWTLLTADQVDVLAFTRLAANSAGLAAITAVLVVGASLLLAYARRLQSRAVLTVLIGLASTGYAVPGAVIAVGVFSLGASIDSVARSLALVPAGQLLLGGSMTALVWAYTVRFVAVGLQPIEAGFTRQGTGLDRAARTLGAGPLRALARVHVPLLRGALAGAVTLAFVDVLKELPLTLILRPFDFATLATQTYELASEERVAASAPSALLLVAFGLVAVAIAQSALLGTQPAGRT